MPDSCISGRGRRAAAPGPPSPAPRPESGRRRRPRRTGTGHRPAGCAAGGTAEQVHGRVAPRGRQRRRRTGLLRGLRLLSLLLGDGAFWGAGGARPTAQPLRERCPRLTGRAGGRQESKGMDRQVCRAGRVSGAHFPARPDRGSDGANSSGFPGCDTLAPLRV